MSLVIGKPTWIFKLLLAARTFGWLHRRIDVWGVKQMILLVGTAWCTELSTFSLGLWQQRWNDDRPGVAVRTSEVGRPEARARNGTRVRAQVVGAWVIDRL